MFARRANHDDVAYLGPNIREADRVEVKASSGQDVREILPLALEVSDCAVTFITDDGRPFAMTGVAAHPEHHWVGVPWLLGTDEFTRVNRRKFIRLCAKTVESYHNRFPVLHNYVDVRNTSAQRFLRRLGFSFGPAVPFGAELRPFRPFYRNQ